MSNASYLLPRSQYSPLDRKLKDSDQRHAQSREILNLFRLTSFTVVTIAMSSISFLLLSFQAIEEFTIFFTYFTRIVRETSFVSFS